MLRWSLCLIPTNVSLDNRSGLSQGMEIFVGLIDIESAVYVRAMRHVQYESSNCHIKCCNYVQFVSILLNLMKYRYCN